MFFRGIDFGVNNNEDILILDIGNCRIQIFDRDGKYLSTIGRKGQGPGEFINPFDIQLDSNNNIYVQDSRKIHVFNNHGNFERSVQLETDFGTFPRDVSLESFGIMENGNFWGNIYSSIPDIGTMDIVIINSEGKLIKKIVCFPAQRLSLINGIRLFLYNPYFAYLYFCPVNPSVGVYGIASEYRLCITDSSGKTLRVIEKDDTPKSISREERRYIINTKIENLKKQNIDINISSSEAEKLLDFKKYRPHYNGILKDEKGNLYIRRSKSVLDSEDYATFDLFNLEGYYLYEIKIPLSPKIIRNGNLYISTSDNETGELVVKRYKIKNWQQIKKGI